MFVYLSLHFFIIETYYVFFFFFNDLLLLSFVFGFVLLSFSMSSCCSNQRFNSQLLAICGILFVRASSLLEDVTFQLPAIILH